MRQFKTMARQTVMQFIAALGILCLLFPAKASAQSNNRWLFIYNTSASMRDRTKSLQSVTADLLTTGMHGTIRAGDTIGIWTYDSELRASEVPLLSWSPETRDNIARHAVDFLGRHRYEKTATFGDVLANMLRVVKMSDTITIILISDGSDSVDGTPFDASVSAFYKTNFTKQKKADLPIVTVFRGEHGTLTTNTLSLTPYVDIPVVPPPAPPKVVAQKPALEAPKPVVPSLVIVGRKARTTTNTANLPDITQEPDDAPTPAATPVATAPAPQPAPAPAAIATAETPKPAPTSLQVTAAEPTPSPVETTKPAPVAVAETPKPVEPVPVAATPAPNWNSTTPVLARESGNATSAPSAATPTQPVAEAVTNAPTNNLFSSRNIAIVSVAFSVLMCVLLIIVARGARRSRASLITRSLDRENQ